MIKKTILAAALLLCGTSGAMLAQSVNIVPTPKQMTTGQGTFRIDASTPIAVKGKGAQEAADFFAEKLRRSVGWTLPQGKAGKEGTISFIINKEVKGTEAYRLKVTPTQVVCEASDEAGLFYAAQSLLQLLPADVERGFIAGNTTSWNIPAVNIDDAPRFSYRGVHLDPCRHFLPVEAVKRQIELLSTYKINHIHWHLTDDQGWRVEIKKHPRLTEIGAFRTEGDGSIHGGYYTQEEIKDVVEFARQHHINIVPELEIPGHELAAIAAYPQLSCQGEAITPRIIWGVEDIVMCPGKEDMFELLKDVIDEMAPLFPSSYFHIGGDESPREEWAKCSNCQKRMKEQGYKQEAQLQTYVIGRVEKYLREKGKHIIGWDEILEGGNLDTTAIVMSWRGEKGGIAAARAGHRVLMTSADHGFYFDHFQGDPAVEPNHISGYSTLEKVYGYNPVPAEVEAAGKSHLVLGVQANNWSEYIHTPARLEYGLYPRALALAEVAWSPMSTRNFKDFARRVDTDHALRLRHHHVNFHIPIPEQPGGSCNRLAFTDNTTLTLKSTRPMTIVYTTDGTLPTPESTRYTSPISISKTTIVRTACVLPCGLMGPVRTITVERQELAPAQALEAPKQGLKMRINYGDFRTASQVPSAADVSDSIVSDFKVMRNLTNVPNNIRNVRNYAAAAEGYVYIPEDGIYEFTTNNFKLWIDGKILIDNTRIDIPRYTHDHAQLALSKGYHQIKSLFIGGIFAGWPTYWDDAAVKMRRPGGKWEALKKEQLFHE